MYLFWISPVGMQTSLKAVCDVILLPLIPKEFGKEGRVGAIFLLIDVYRIFSSSNDMFYYIGSSDLRFSRGGSIKRIRSNYHL